MPAYNEAEYIFSSAKETSKVFTDVDCEHEIIVVDDGSKDDTYEEALRASLNFDHIRVVRYDPNLGKGFAIAHGFKFVTGELVAFLDADLDLHPKQLQTFLDYMRENDADVVVGSKRHPLSEIDYPFHRRIISGVYYGVAKVLFGLPVKDTQTGLKLFKYEVLERVMPKILVKRYAFDLEILANAHHLGYKIVEAPIILGFRRKFSRIYPQDVYYTWKDTMAVFYRLHILKYYDHVEINGNTKSHHRHSG